MRSAVLCCAAFFFAISASAIPQTFPKRAGGPILTFTADGVRASGATPGATLYFAGVSLVGGNYTLRVEKTAGSATADASGVAEFAAAVARRSVWIVVDPEKDGYTVAAPPGMPIQEMDFPGAGVGADENGQMRRLLLSRFSVDCYLIRPGVGVWTAYVRDGGPFDSDQSPNGAAHADLNALTPVGSTAGQPERFSAGDYLFLVDRNSLEFHVARRGRQ